MGDGEVLTGAPWGPGTNHTMGHGPFLKEKWGAALRSCRRAVAELKQGQVCVTSSDSKPAHPRQAASPPAKAQGGPREVCLLRVPRVRGTWGPGGAQETAAGEQRPQPSLTRNSWSTSAHASWAPRSCHLPRAT